MKTIPKKYRGDRASDPVYDRDDSVRDAANYAFHSLTRVYGYLNSFAKGEHLEMWQRVETNSENLSSISLADRCNDHSA